MDYRALISAMHNASGSMNTDTVRVTIPEGYTVKQIIALLAKNGVNTEEALTEAAETATFDYSYIDNSSEDISRLEGYLFPDTYDFYLNEKPASALGRLIKNFNSKLDDDLLDRAEERGYDLKDIITIASLIEKETDGTDQTKIASVIYNRLEGSGDKQGTYGLLQIDASLLYALPDHEGSITEADKQTDSPYNSISMPGLPPTPIANPGLCRHSGSAGTGQHRLLLLRPRQGRGFITSSPTTPITWRSSTAVTMQETKMRRGPELLAPAGDMERLKNGGGLWCRRRVSGGDQLRHASLCRKL